MNLEQLRKALADKVKGLDELETKAIADDATEEDVKALDSAMDEIDELKEKIALLERVEATKASQAEPVDTPVEPTGRVAAKPTEKLTALGKVGIGIQALMGAHNSNKSWRAQMEENGFTRLADEFDTLNKANNSVTGSAGGFAVPEDFNEEIFQELRPYTAFLAGQPEVIPMPHGNYRQSGVAARPSAGYRAEGAAIAISEPTLLEINMSAKLLSGLVPMTNQLIQYSDQRAAAMGRNTLAAAMGLAMDTAAFEGNGAGNNPLGIFNAAGINTDAAAAGTTPDQATVDAAVRPLVNNIMLFATLGVRVAWIMPQRVLGYLQDMTDGNGNYIYPTLQGDNPSWKGFPVLKPGTLTINGGAGTNETTIGLVSFGNILMGETGGLEIAVSSEASYVDGGTTVSAFQNDMTLIRATMEHDWQPRYGEAVNTLTNVQWGA